MSNTIAPVVIFNAGGGRTKCWMCREFKGMYTLADIHRGGHKAKVCEDCVKALQVSTEKYRDPSDGVRELYNTGTLTTTGMNVQAIRKAKKTYDAIKILEAFHTGDPVMIELSGRQPDSANGSGIAFKLTSGKHKKLFILNIWYGRYYSLPSNGVMTFAPNRMTVFNSMIESVGLGDLMFKSNVTWKNPELIAMKLLTSKGDYMRTFGKEIAKRYVPNKEELGVV